MALFPSLLFYMRSESSPYKGLMFDNIRKQALYRMGSVGMITMIRAGLSPALWAHLVAALPILSDIHLVNYTMRLTVTHG